MVSRGGRCCSRCRTVIDRVRRVAVVTSWRSAHPRWWWRRVGVVFAWRMRVCARSNGAPASGQVRAPLYTVCRQTGVCHRSIFFRPQDNVGRLARIADSSGQLVTVIGHRTEPALQ